MSRDRPLIGILGAAGAVGSAASRFLAADGGVRLRLGGRREEPLRALAAELGGTADARSVDLGDDDALTAFCTGCDVVLCCAGPSYAVGDRVARAALAAGADVVEVTGDEPVRSALAGDPLLAGRRAVVSAGLLPGLSALLPRWMARHRGLRRLRGYAGGLERCTPAAAGDLLLSLPGAADEAVVFGSPGAVWRAGDGVVPRARSSRDAVRAPHFSEEGFVQPFLTREAERLAADLAVEELEWSTVHLGPRVRELLTGRAGRPAGDPTASDLAGAVGALRRAADLDLAGRTPGYLLVLEAIDGAGSPATLVLRTPDSYALTGRVGAWTALETAAGSLPEGAHHAADVLDPDRAVEVLFGGADRPVRADGAGAPSRPAAPDLLRIVEGPWAGDRAEEPVEEGTL